MLIIIETIESKRKHESTTKYFYTFYKGERIKGDFLSKHPLYYKFPKNGIVSVIVKPDKNGAYQYCGLNTGKCHFNFRTRSHKLEFGICRDFAKVVLEEGKRYRIGNYYNLIIKTMI